MGKARQGKVLRFVVTTALMGAPVLGSAALGCGGTDEGPPINEPADDPPVMENINVPPDDGVGGEVAPPEQPAETEENASTDDEPPESYPTVNARPTPD